VPDGAEIGLLQKYQNFDLNQRVAIELWKITNTDGIFMNLVILLIDRE